MARSDIERIRGEIHLRQYDLTAHALEELAEDLLDIDDLENAVMTGPIKRVERDDPRGTKYILEGMAVDQKTPVGVVGRFTGHDQYLIITVYEITPSEG